MTEENNAADRMQHKGYKEKSHICMIMPWDRNKPGTLQEHKGQVPTLNLGRSRKNVDKLGNSHGRWRWGI